MRNATESDYKELLRYAEHRSAWMPICTLYWENVPMADPAVMGSYGKKEGLVMYHKGEPIFFPRTEAEQRLKWRLEIRERGGGG